MVTKSNRWTLAEKITPEVEEEFKEFHPLLRQILFNRGFRAKAEAMQFLSGEYGGATDPFLLLDMDKAVDRIAAALETGESIAVYGDYDADGVTATALMVEALKELGANVIPYIPNRFDEGYGLNNDALAYLEEEGVTLVITVDCGIRASENVTFANEELQNLDIIITDHHSPGDEHPHALAVINPKRDKDPYPTKNLSGVGTAYKVICGLASRLNRDHFNPESYLDLVAIGTIADLVPLTGENRVLVQKGLDRLRRPHRQGIISLLGVAGISPEKITATHVGFSVGPRLNAAGRLNSALTALDLLLAKDLHKSGSLAQELDNQNRERQKVTKEMQKRAEEILQVENNGVMDEPPLLIFVTDESFNSGVVGLTASRLTEEYYRPCIVAQHGDEFTRGSCRSIDEFHITDALDQCADLLTHHGGHKAAAGFTVPNNNLSELKDRLSQIAEEQLSGCDLRPEIKADAEISLDELTFETLRLLDLLEPTGFDNSSPVFITKNLNVEDSRTVGKDKSHLKLTVSNGKARMNAIAFRFGYLEHSLAPKVDLIYRFEQNEYLGRISLQLNILDIKPSTQWAT